MISQVPELPKLHPVGVDILIKSNEKNIRSLEEKNRLIQEQVNDKEMEKEEMGFELYRCYQKIDRIHQDVAGLNEELAKAKSDLKLTQVAKDISTEHAIAAQKSQKDYEVVIAKLNNKMNELQETIVQLRGINAVYSSTLKVHKTIDEKSKRELDFHTSKLNEMKYVLEKERDKIQELTIEKKDLKRMFEKKKEETEKLNIVVQDLRNAMAKITDENAALNRQWEEAIQAMKKRDLTLQTVQDTNQKIRAHLLASETTSHSLNNDFMQLESKLSVSLKENKELKDELCRAKNEITKLQEEVKTSKNLEYQYHRTETLQEKDIQKLGIQLEKTQENLLHKEEAVIELKSKIEQMRISFENSMTDTMREQVSKQVSKLVNENEKRTETIMKIKHQATEVIRNNMEQLRVENLNTKDEISLMKKEKENYVKLLNDSREKYMALHQEATQFIYSLERRELELNNLKAKMDVQGQLDFIPYQNSINKLTKDLEAFKYDKDKYHALWVETQREVMKWKTKVNELMDKNNHLQTKLTVDHVGKQKDAGLIEEANDKASQFKLEASKYWSELQRIRPQIKELKDKNYQLESELIEYRLKVEEYKLNGKCSSDMLKTEVKRLYKSQTELKKDSSINLQKATIIEKKNGLLREIIAQLKKERYELQKSNFDLKHTVEDMNLKYQHLKNEYTRFCEVMSKKGFSSKDKISIGFGGLKPSTASSSNEMNKEMLKEHQATSGDIPPLDPQAWRLKITTLGMEKEHLLNENNHLKLKLSQLNNVQTDSQSKLSQKQSKVSELEQIKTQFEQENKYLAAQAKKAERIASYIEQQLKTLVPNHRIDYQKITDSDPSVQLVAALIVKPSEIN